MKRTLTLALLVGTAAFGGRLATTALAGGAEQSAASSASKGTATLLANGTVVTTGISLPGQGVTLPANCAGANSQTSKIVCTANAFLATLSAAQKAKVLLPATKANVARWSNLPVTFVPRNGVELGTLNSAQRAAALAVVKAAMGSAANEGYDEAMKLLMADDILNVSGGMSGPNAGGGNGGTPPSPPTAGTGSNGTTPTGSPPQGAPTGAVPAGGAAGGNDYGNGKYYLAFLGTPSTTGTWLLQFGGHHLAVNTTYQAGQVISATPKFTGLEPKVWTASGKTYAPLQGEQGQMATMLAGLNSTQRAQAKLSQSFNDVVVGPGKDAQFPATKVGVKVSTLSATQKVLVLEAMKPWVQDADDATAARLMAVYKKELDDTYVAYSGDLTLTKNADYVRIDGPSVWIELVCQNGIVYGSQIHYHSIWRDHQRDYGAQYKF